jgi:hypothetical protein
LWRFRSKDAQKTHRSSQLLDPAVRKEEIRLADNALADSVEYKQIEEGWYIVEETYPWSRFKCLLKRCFARL